MKRVYSLICILALLLTSCSFNGKPSNISDACFDLGMKAIDAADDYLDGRTTAIVAAGQVQDLCSKLSEQPDEAGSLSQEVKNYAEVLGYTLMRAANGDTYAEGEILTARNNLARVLEQDEREE